MLKNILFDLDGTLTDPAEGVTACIRHALIQLERTPPPAAELTWCIGPPLRDSFAQLLEGDDDHLFDLAMGHYRQRFAERGMFENQLYPGIQDALARVESAGYRLFLATSKPWVFAEQITAHFELASFFDAEYGSELDGRLANKGELIGHILTMEQLDPAKTLMIGDRKHDIVGGRVNGVQTAGVTYGYGSLDEMREYAPDLLFHTTGDWADFLVGL